MVIRRNFLSSFRHEMLYNEYMYLFAVSFYQTLTNYSTKLPQQIWNSKLHFNQPDLKTMQVQTTGLLGIIS